MQSLFAAVDESRAEGFRARGLGEAFARNPSLLRSVSLVAATLRTHFLCGAGWRSRIHDGSLTFQHVHSTGAVKVLVDLDNALAARSGVTVEDDPVVLGVELTRENPFVRELVRDYLHTVFGDRYLDPRETRPGALAIVKNHKYWFAPHEEHRYDIVYMPPPERMPLTADERLVEGFERRLRAHLSPTVLPVGTRP